MATTKNATRKAKSKALKSHTVDIKIVPVPTKREAQLLKTFRKMDRDDKRRVELMSFAFANPKPVEATAPEEAKTPDYESMSHEDLRKAHGEHGRDVCQVISSARAREYVRGLLKDLVSIQNNIAVHEGVARAASTGHLTDYIDSDSVLQACHEAIGRENGRLCDTVIALEGVIGVCSYNEPHEDIMTSFMRSAPAAHPTEGTGDENGVGTRINGLLLYDIADGLREMSNVRSQSVNEVFAFFKKARTVILEDAQAGGLEASYTKNRRREVRVALGSGSSVQIGDGKD